VAQSALELPLVGPSRLVVDALALPPFTRTSKGILYFLPPPEW